MTLTRLTPLSVNGRWRAAIPAGERVDILKKPVLTPSVPLSMRREEETAKAEGVSSEFLKGCP